MNSEHEDEPLVFADARRALLHTMRRVRSVSERIDALVTPWEALGFVRHFTTNAREE